MTIGKGADQKLYYPDYLIVALGFPIVVVEAKSPVEKIDEGFRPRRCFLACNQYAIAAHFRASSRLRNKSAGQNSLFSFKCAPRPVRSLRNTDILRALRVSHINSMRVGVIRQGAPPSRLQPYIRPHIGEDFFPGHHGIRAQ
jgi:hypothetical protein